MASASPLKRSHESMEPSAPAATSFAGEEAAISSCTGSDMATPSDIVGAPDAPITNHDISNPPLSPHIPSIQQQSPSSLAIPTAERPAKKRKKLTDVERQQKEEEKARKEAEKHAKEEEKKLKQAQMEEARRVKAEKDEEKRKAKESERAKREESKKRKEAEKQLKEAEKQAKEEEKAKKERSQKRISNFFNKPQHATDSANSSRRNSIASVDGQTPIFESRTASEAPEPSITVYNKTFPSFFVHQHTTLAPLLEQPLDQSRVESALQEIWDSNRAATKTVDELAAFRTESLKANFVRTRQRDRYTAPPSVKELISQLQNSASNPVDLINEMGKGKKPLDVLQTLPIKYLKYREDVRPPWIGTFTKKPGGANLRRLALHPFTKALTGVNYDYDSEAEWEEPEEGEDLGSEDEEELDDDDGDMEGFLDDENDAGVPKRKQILGDLVPQYTQVHWEDPMQESQMAPFGDTTIDLAQFRMEILLPGVNFPIDPFSNKYWDPQPSDNMGPPTRNPLDTIQGPNHQISTRADQKPTSKTAIKLATAKPLAPELLEDFKKAVDGSNLTKLGLIEVLKKKFPSATRNTVEQTLLQVAERVGSKPTEKVWKLKGS